jgi:hypothetical protein
LVLYSPSLYLAHCYIIFNSFFNLELLVWTQVGHHLVSSLVVSELLQPNVVVEWLTLLLGIQEVPGSNLGPETGYPYWGFSWLFSVCPGKSRDSILNSTIRSYSGRKITASFGNVTVRGEKYGKGKGEARWRRVCLSMYSITENIYYSQLSSVALLLKPEPVSHSVIQGKDWVLSSYVLSSCGLPVPPTRLLVTVNETRSYFASTLY